jgi:hypothetical protein
MRHGSRAMDGIELLNGSQVLRAVSCGCYKEAACRARRWPEEYDKPYRTVVSTCLRLSEGSGLECESLHTL